MFERLTPEQIVRYAKTMVAITCEKNNPQFHDPVPVWFAYLLSDAFRRVNNPNEIAVKKSWSLANLLTLLQSEDADESTGIQQILGAFFERKNDSSWYDDGMLHICELPDFKDFLATHQALACDFLRTLSARGQVVFLNYLKKQDLSHADNAVFVSPAFTALVVALALSDKKTVRELATPLLGGLGNEQTVSHLSEFLSNGTSKERTNACDYLARLGETARPILQNALAQEKLKSVQTAITNALARLDTAEQAGDTDIELPPMAMPEIQTLSDSIHKILSENFDLVYERYQKDAEEEQACNEAHKGDKNYYKSTWRQHGFKSFAKINKESFIKDACDALKGNGKNSQFNRDYLKEVVNFNKTISNLPEFGLYHALLLDTHPSHHWVNWDDVFNFCKPEHWQDLELRQFVYYLEQVGFGSEKANRLIAENYLEDRWSILSDFIMDDDKIYPFFVENPEFLEEAFGLLPNKSDNRYYGFTAENAINILGKFPTLPKIFIAPLLELALGNQKTLRFQAQELLARLPNVHERAIEALADGKQEIRITAIKWLARLNEKSAIKPLYDLLKKEKKEVVIAEILTALESLGEDISPYLDPKALLKDAQKGLKGKISSTLAWFDFDGLPAVSWQNGKAVDKDIVKWWVVLAEKTKDPRPNALFVRYLELLDEKSQKALSLHLLQAFIAEDTRHPSLDEASKIAERDAQGRLDDYQYWYKQSPEWHPEYANITLEQVKAEIIREHMSIYLGSAIKSKGLLALATKTQGAVAVKILQDFMKNHYNRRSQVEAMLMSFATSDDPLIIQLLLGISRRYKMQTIQELAKSLVGEIAERNGWTADELADRTIPTAGFDDDGILRIEYGSRHLTAYIDDKDKFVLKNEYGKVIKSLPTARADDDKTLIKDAKALFSNAKKEYKQVLDLQTARLYEAMCAERSWASSDWQEYLYKHPLMKRLVARLVWLELDGTGAVVQAFRPADDGSLLNLDDDEITLGAGSRIKVAHRVLLDDETAEDWVGHFKDYKVEFLFNQMINALPDLTATPAYPEQASDETTINAFKGYLTDTYSLRGIVTKMGYVRASIEDGGSFDSYYKPFDSLGVSAVIGFSGSYVPEENLPAVVYGLSFEDKTVRSWSKPNKPIAEIPPVLLAECFADYQALAEKTQGFDKEWEKKTPW
ncbi:DUF4132 domain-containing protein [Moraxella bovis]|uniref:DUF4132 domain-containing protein n=1 Tax=Moraxella bovis TaxID=476 RepID=UPI0022270AD8|nr:DUF4132 domain-containing protein [Moraxella bovis]UZA39295.1 DUF4132 domain-containing protein [Moraxella bovis]